MAEPLLCLLASCRLPGRHAEDCPGDDCRGCQRARAADGLRLCQRDTERIGQDATTAAELYDELALRLAGGTGGGEPVSGTSDTTRLPNPAAVEARATIRHTLMSWVQLVAEERGVSLPDGSPPARPVKAMSDTPIWRGQGTIEQAIAGPPQVTVQQAAAFVAKHAEWLAATEYADEVATELHELRAMAWRVAYPSGARVIEIAPCPQPSCGGTVKAIVRPKDSLLPSELVCDACEEHRWPAGQWHSFRRAVKARVA